jgi:catechol 2,3-dioxygenase-like lactoylglutathione lyase family enzyme
LDHVVLNVGDVERSLDFYQSLGLKAERVDEYRRGVANFPSVRVNAGTIIDLFPPSMHADVPAGQNMNHLCLAVSESTERLRRALAAAAIAIERTACRNFGARGYATAFYVRDPDGNTIELRSYRN